MLLYSIVSHSLCCAGDMGCIHPEFESGEQLCLQFFTARCSCGSAVLGVVILSVCHTCASWQNQTMHCRYFDTTRKGNDFSFLTPTVVGGRRHLPSEICAQSDPPPFEKGRFWQISAYNVSTIRDSEKVQLWWTGSWPQAFQRAIDGMRTLPWKTNESFLHDFDCYKIADVPNLLNSRLLSASRFSTKFTIMSYILCSLLCAKNRYAFKQRPLTFREYNS